MVPPTVAAAHSATAHGHCVAAPDTMTSMDRSNRRLASRRRFLGLAGSLAGATFLAACGTAPEEREVTTAATAAGSILPPEQPLAIATQVPPPPAPPGPGARWAAVRGDRRQLERLALPGTPWETPVYINRSGEPGPSVMVLGGVHGNEPGGWGATDEIASWMPDRGILTVIPRANVLAIEAGERTSAELGDLNRFYPGVPLESTNAFPMQWMAYRIVELAREFEVDLLLDLHESWGFFNERTQDGTAFLGQTVTRGGAGGESGRIEVVVAAVNEQISEREQLVMRDRNRFRGTGLVQRPTFDPSWPRGGTSSLGIGSFVPGLVPVLIEMGQQNQAVSRRAELHQLFVRTALEHEGLLADA